MNDSDAIEGAIALMHQILQERDMPLYPDAAKKAGVCYTDFLTRAHEHKFATDDKTGENYVYTPNRNRYCSIGYHEECTDPTGERCGCPCHPLAELIRSLGEKATPKKRQAGRKGKG